MRDMDKDTIFLTGAGGVLGRAYIDKLLNAGARVIATDIPGIRADELKKLHSDKPNFSFYELDVSNESQCEDIFSRVINDGLIPNVVINNAAITGELLMGEGKGFPDFANTSSKDFSKTIETNLVGAFYIARQMDRDLVGKYDCKLINVASMYALNGAHHNIYEGMPFNNFSAYSVSKAGIHGLTIWLAGYWAKHNVTVNTIAPGAVYNNHSAEFKRRVEGLLMLNRMAVPEEIADAMMFLISSDSRYITGQILNVDGGFSAW